MKSTLLALILMLTSVASHAFWRTKPLPTEDSSWQEISRDYRVIYRAPQIRIGGHFLRPSSVCIDGDNIRTKKMVTECRDWGRNDCRREETLHRYKPISGVERRCRWVGGGDNERCEEYDAPYTIPLTYDIAVYRRVNGGRDSDDFTESSRYRPLFTKVYNIEACEE